MLAEVNEMYSPEMETELDKIERNGMTEVAHSLRKMRDEISKRNGLPTVKQEKNLSHFNMPQKYQRHFENDYPVEKRPALFLLRDLINDGKRTIILTGKPGIGKTFAACKWLKSNKYGKFVLSSHLVSLNEHITNDRVELYFYQKCTNLVIDDLGRGAETLADKARLTDLISQRADNNLFTVCTCVICPDFGINDASIKRRLTIRICE